MPIHCQDVGQSLNRLKHVILDHWENDVRLSINHSEEEHSIIIRDHLHDIIDNLILYLTKGELDEMELGKAHGNHRAILTKFTVQDILKEYSLLRETLITYLYPIGEIGCSKLIHKYIDIIAKNSVTEFLSETYVKRVNKEEGGSEIKELKQDLKRTLNKDFSSTSKDLHP